MKPPQTIAIHGVGSHKPGVISERVTAAFARISVGSNVSEFNWDDYIGHSAQRIGEGIALLDQLAEAVSRTACLPLPAQGSKSSLVQRLGEALFHSVFRVLIAITLAVLTIGPVAQLLVLLPSIGFDSTSWLNFSWIWTVARVGIVATAVVLMVMLGLSMFHGLMIRSLAPIWVTIRRAVLLVFQPLLLLLTIPMAARLGSGLVTAVASAIPFFLFGGIVGVVLSPLSGDFDLALVSTGAWFAMLAAAALFGGLHIVARGLWVGGPLKVVLDIVRYMGAPTYRTTLQNAFDDYIRNVEVDASGKRCVTLLAHSLGSVIALDSLVNSAAWRSTDTVNLVTMGSPIRRSFIRFFPGYLFPTSVDEAARLVASRVGRFSWINIHRRWDYVGTSLGLNREGLGQDLSTGQITRILRSHSNYWGDGRVVTMINDALSRAESVVASPITPTPSHALPDAAGSQHLESFAHLARTVAVGVVIGIVSLAAVSLHRAYSKWDSALKTELVEVARSGVSTLADVTYHRTVVHAGEDSYYVHHYLFTIPGQVLPAVEIDGGSQDTRFDYRALAAFVLEQCERTEKKRWWQIFRSVREIPCTRSAITLMVNPAKAESFWLPQFPPRVRAWEPALNAIGLLMFGVFFAVGSTFLVVVVGARLFRLFLGMSAVEARRNSPGIQHGA